MNTHAGTAMNTCLSTFPSSAAPAAGATMASAAAELRFVDDYLPALLAQASQLISSEFHQVVRRHGLCVSEWRVLASLAGGVPVSIGRLAQVTVTKQPTVTRLLDRMQARGEVARVPHGSDRRVTLVRITRKGTKTVEHLMELAREHEMRVLAPFGLAPAEELKHTLRRMIELHAGPAPDPRAISAGSPRRAAATALRA